MRIADKQTTLGKLLEGLGAPSMARLATWPEVGLPEQRALARALTGRWESGSAEHKQFEATFAAVQGLPADHQVITATSGTVALRLLLEALDIGARDEVIVPGLTRPETVAAVLDVNAVPCLVDVEPDTFTLDPGKVEAYLRSASDEGRTLPKAIIVTHLYNRIGAMEAFVRIAQRWDVLLIEDCAHAHGGRWGRRALGAFGVGSVFCSGPSSVLASSGGGVIVTGVPLLAARLRTLVNGGRPVSVSPTGVKVDALTARWRRRVDALGLDAGPIQSGDYGSSALDVAILNAQLGRFLEQLDKRVATLAALERELPSVPGIRLLAAQPRASRPIAYKFGFELDPDAFGGMDSATFCAVLSALLGGYEVTGPYDPLGGGGAAGYSCPVYDPRTKSRHRLDDAYSAAIDPARFELPVAHHAAARLVLIEHSFLRDPHAVEGLVAALVWMGENADRILAV